jgi:tryptophan-rich sensory protein
MSDYTMRTDYFEIDEVRTTTSVGFNNRTTWIIGIILLIVIIIALVAAYNGFNSAAFQALNPASFTLSSAAFAFLWILAFLIIWYAWYTSLNGTFDPSLRTTLNVLFALNLLLVLIFVFALFSSINLKGALCILFLLFIETLFLIYFVWKSSRTGAYLLILYAIFLLILMCWNNSLVTANP